jgi:hypothetical protein
MADAVKEALEKVHASLNDNNVGLDACIGELKAALAAAGQATVTMDKTRLPNNSRPGRKMLQSYFKKRGVIVEFAE